MIIDRVHTSPVTYAKYNVVTSVQFTVILSHTGSKGSCLDKGGNTEVISLPVDCSKREICTLSSNQRVEQCKAMSLHFYGYYTYITSSQFII